eukprot:Gb_22819 [translate_table: standard]
MEIFESGELVREQRIAQLLLNLKSLLPQDFLPNPSYIITDAGASPSSWAVWTRAWTAEENRHGDLLNKYVYLSGRVDMRQIEKTIQYLIGSGMPRNVETIAADEKRHETAYAKIVEKLFEIDPDCTVLAEKWFYTILSYDPDRVIRGENYLLVVSFSRMDVQSLYI